MTASLEYASTARRRSLLNASRLCRGLDIVCTARNCMTLRRGERYGRGRGEPHKSPQPETLLAAPPVCNHELPHRREHHLSPLSDTSHQAGSIRALLPIVNTYDSKQRYRSSLTASRCATRPHRQSAANAAARRRHAPTRGHLPSRDIGVCRSPICNPLKIKRAGSGHRRAFRKATRWIAYERPVPVALPGRH